jgi:hypothetical protein
MTRNLNPGEPWSIVDKRALSVEGACQFYEDFDSQPDNKNYVAIFSLGMILNIKLILNFHGKFILQKKIFGKKIHTKRMIKGILYLNLQLKIYNKDQIKIPKA